MAVLKDGHGGSVRWSAVASTTTLAPAWGLTSRSLAHPAGPLCVSGTMGPIDARPGNCPCLFCGAGQGRGPEALGSPWHAN